MPDPGFTLNCPYCGSPVAYVRSEDDTHFYQCPTDGPLVLPPDGRLRREVTVPPINGTFKDALRALLDAGPAPLNPKPKSPKKRR